MKEIEDTNNWKNILCSCVGHINIVKMFILLKVIYRFIAIPIKILFFFFSHRNEANNPKIFKDSRIVKAILRKNN